MKTVRSPSVGKEAASGPGAPLTAPVGLMQPLFWRGESGVAIQGHSHWEIPSKPQQDRSIRNCQMFCASPINIMTIAIPARQAA